jgi:hypothetical protein
VEIMCDYTTVVVCQVPPIHLGSIAHHLPSQNKRMKQTRDKQVQYNINPPIKKKKRKKRKRKYTK